MDIRNGECIELLKTIPDKSVDLFICDLPYGETNCKWDTKIDMADFWKEFKRVRKSKKTACIHFCSTKFGYSLIKSNEGMFKMDMVWKKRNKTGGLQSRHRPMRNHEMVYFFYEQAPKYNRDKYHKRIVAKPKVTKEENSHCGVVPEDQSFKTCKLSITGSNQNFDPKLPASVILEKNGFGFDITGINNHGNNNFEPPNPGSVVEEPTDVYGETKKKRKARRKKGDSNFEPVNPSSVVEEKDVWGQTKFKDGGDCGRLNKDGTYKLGYEPPNPSSVLEEETARKLYKNTTYGDIELKKAFGSVFEPPNPASILEENTTDIYGEPSNSQRKKEKGFDYAFVPPNPASVVEEKDEFGWDKSVVKDMGNKIGKVGANFEPPNPASVLIEDDRVDEKGKSAHGWDITHMDKPRVAHFDPKLPASVLEESEDKRYGEYTQKVGEGFGYTHGSGIQKNKTGDARFPLTFDPPNPASVVEEKEGQIKAKDWGYKKCSKSFDNNEDVNGGRRIGANFEPPNPVSVVVEETEAPTRKSIKNRQGLNTKTDLYPPENRTSSSFEPTNPASVVVEEDEYIIPAEDEPKSMYESTKVFIGKRNHQTEKPQDILEFFLKYWTDEDDVVLDPTMGSGSTGVACKKLNRKFIGFELDEKIFKVAEKRINK